MSTLIIYSGDDQVYTGQITKDGAPLDLTGMLAATFLVKTDVNDADAAALITKTLGVGLVVVAPPTSGVITITLDAADTGSRPGQTLHCALKLMDGAGKTHTVYDGPFSIVRPGVRVAV